MKAMLYKWIKGIYNKTSLAQTRLAWKKSLRYYPRITIQDKDVKIQTRNNDYASSWYLNISIVIELLRYWCLWSRISIIFLYMHWKIEGAYHIISQFLHVKELTERAYWLKMNSSVLKLVKF